ncbi:hypothetical protein ACWCSH_42020 [Streptosporangium sp. NPDC001682]
MSLRIRHVLEYGDADDTGESPVIDRQSSQVAMDRACAAVPGIRMKAMAAPMATSDPPILLKPVISLPVVLICGKWVASRSIHRLRCDAPQIGSPWITPKSIFRDFRGLVEPFGGGPGRRISGAVPVYRNRTGSRSGQMCRPFS